MSPDYRFDSDYRWDDLSDKIVGRVIDSLGADLLGATVELHRTSDNALIATTTSTAHGEFEFAGLADITTEHYVTAALTGYTTATSIKTLKAGDHIELTLTTAVVPVVQPGGGGYPWHKIELYKEQERRRELEDEDDEILVAIMAFVTGAA